MIFDRTKPNKKGEEMMALKKKFWLQVVCVLTMVTLVCVPSLFAATDEVEITGTVYAIDRDENNNVTAVLIVTDEGEEIVIANSGKGMELLLLDEKTVKATGMVAKDEDGNKTITVNNYIILE